MTKMAKAGQKVLLDHFLVLGRAVKECLLKTKHSRFMYPGLCFGQLLSQLIIK